jgi:hypothetical protein
MSRFRLTASSPIPLSTPLMMIAALLVLNSVPLTKNAAESRYRSLPDNPEAVDPATREKRAAAARAGYQQNGGHQK